MNDTKIFLIRREEFRYPSQNTNQTRERREKLFRKYLSSDEWEDVHLAGVGVFHGRDDEAGAAQRDLTLRPAVHRQRQLPFAHVEHAGKLHALRAAHAARLTWKERERQRQSFVNKGTK